MREALQWIRSLGLEPVLRDYLASNGPSLTNPYHGMAHGLRVAYAAGQAVAEMGGENDAVRTATVAGLFHDWEHPGKMGPGHDDKLNVDRSALKVATLLDGPFGFSRMEAAEAIRDTQYPYNKFKPSELGLVLRDADIWHMAALTEMEFLEIQAGLAAEMGGVPLGEWIAGNAKFIEVAETWTSWGERQAEGNRKRLVTWCKRWAGQLS